jgi:hypothetical protein
MWRPTKWLESLTGRRIGTMNRATVSCAAAASTLLLGALVAGQEPPEDTRQIVAEEFVEARPAGASARPPRRPKMTKPSVVASVAELGVTIWRLRPAATGDSTRLLVQEDDQSTGWVPERVDAGQKLALGDRVRLSFETPRSGFLYVLDREEYADGTFSDTYLIFPTRRPIGSNNSVKSGRLVEVPTRDDRPNYFTVKQSRPDQVAEVLTAIVSEKPLTDLPLATGPTKLPPALMTRWDAEWRAPVEQVVVPGGDGARGWSAAEAQAGAEPSRLLTQDDAPPQTIYRVQTRPGRPLFVHIRLPYGASSPRP